MTVKIVIDAGHGYNTPGKRTPDGSMREWEFNAATAEHVKRLLSKYDGVQVLFTHDPTGKVDVPLKERTDKANRWGANVFVSIHANAHGNGAKWTDAHGIETYIHPNASATSKALAQKIQSAMIRFTGRRDRGVRTADFHVLRETKMPAVLVECGFMTNKEEAKLLKDKGYREKCASAIVEALVAQFKLKPKQATKPTTPAKPANNVLFKVQVGAFANRNNAERLKKELESKGYKAMIVEEVRK